MKDFTKKVAELQQQVEQKSEEVKIMQTELKQVKEFRRRKAQMQAELDSIRESLFETNKVHKTTMERMGHKVCFSCLF